MVACGAIDFAPATRIESEEAAPGSPGALNATAEGGPRGTPGHAPIPGRHVAPEATHGLFTGLLSRTGTFTALAVLATSTIPCAPHNL